ncbi:MAG: chorismate mutase [Culturomica sp.]|nr:chorismate mutase [Culturomica sp.]
MAQNFYIKAMEFSAIYDWNIWKEEDKPLLIAGPCSAENRKQVIATAEGLSIQGVKVFRAGVWKPRTQPESFAGVGQMALDWLQEVKEVTGMYTCTEVATPKHVEAVLKAGIDILWIGSRTTTNPFAVQEIANVLKGTDTVVLVKNPLSPDIDLWIGALKRLYTAGLRRIAAIHRGFHTGDNIALRNAPLWHIPIDLKCRYPSLPIFCDPSHITGNRKYISDIAQKSMDLGFNGLMIEVHNSPNNALSDASQQITPKELSTLISNLQTRNIVPIEKDFIKEIEVLRSQIDDIDLEILSLLSKRMNISKKIGEYKKQSHVTILQANRWNEIMSRLLQKGSELNMRGEFLNALYNIIHEESINQQQLNDEPSNK